MGVAAPGDGLWLGDDLLVALAQLAKGRSMGSPALLDRLGRQNGIDFSRASLDSAAITAKKGGAATGPNPTGRGKPGTERHVLTDAKGFSLALKLTGVNVHDSRMLDAVADAVPPIRSCWGRPRKMPSKLHADKAYDHRRCRQAMSRRRNQHRIA